MPGVRFKECRNCRQMQKVPQQELALEEKGNCEVVFFFFVKEF
jgi:hypothetical protein